MRQIMGSSGVRSRLALRWSAFGFALATAYNSVVAIREDLPGEPLGIGVPLPVRTATLAGWGSAVAAPWPMPLAAVLAAARSGSPDGVGRSAAGPAMVCAGLGLAGVVGILIEPNTYRARCWTPATRRAALLHMATCAALAGSGIWQVLAGRAGA